MLSKVKRLGVLLVLCGWPFGLVFLGDPLIVVFAVFCNGWALIAWLAHQDQRANGGSNARTHS